MNGSGEIQHLEIILGTAMAIAALGIFFCSLAGRWIGGVWLAVLAIVASLVLAYRLLFDDSVFSDFKTDLLRRVLIGLIPFAVGTAALSFKKVPWYARLVFALVSPTLLIFWVFFNYAPLTHVVLLEQKAAPVAIVILIAWGLIEPLASRSVGAAVPIVIGCTTGGLAFLLKLSAEAQAGMIAPILPATALGALLAAIAAFFMSWKISFARGPVLMWLTAMGALYAFMWVDTDKLPLSYLYGIAAAPLLAWVPEIGPIRRMKPWKRQTLRLVLVAIPVLIAVGLAWKKDRDENKASGDEYAIAPSVMGVPPMVVFDHKNHV